jgi:nucleotide-binding universal stress UspA family protein
MAAPEGEAPASKVALAVDASPASRCATAWAAKLGLLSRPGTEVHLLTVVPTPPLPAPPMRPTFTPGPLLPAAAAGMAAVGVEEYMRRVDEERAEHVKLLNDTAAELVRSTPGLQPSCVRQQVLEGDGAGGSSVGACIVNYCARERVDHLVLGSRGLGALRRALYAAVGLGSVSDYVLHHSPCPVSIVPHVDEAASKSQATQTPRRVEHEWRE